ncbi:hypothetical protein K8Q98_02540 [Candidatus Nomurabacteria bacterium]|nr:hypothetical protein [Candidatus Nomurabacteria bacterium]
MTKRNLIILITLFIIISVFSYFYFFQSVTTPRVNEETNFLSKFNPFGSSKPAQPTNEEPTEGPVNNEGEPENEVVATSNLRKVSSMATAGYGIFRKERFKEIPEVTPTICS